MRFSSTGLVASLAASTVAEDLLFMSNFQSYEYTEATSAALGFTAKVVTEAQWMAMSTSDFAAFKAIIIADKYCDSDLLDLDFLNKTKAIWSPAVTGNIILIGTDPTYHFSIQPGARVLIDNAIKFAAAGTSTGLYFALSCFYTSVNNATVTALSEFGDFEVRGNLDCYNEAHKVADSPALKSLTDAPLSNWSCSVHEAFSAYPQTGVGGFQALAIAQDIVGLGSQTFADGTMGLPYIISRGATPVGCGNGIWEPQFGEECDDGKNNGVAGDPCSLSCKCLSGSPDGKGGCLPGGGGGGNPNKTAAIAAGVIVPIVAIMALAGAFYWWKYIKGGKGAPKAGGREPLSDPEKPFESTASPPPIKPGNTHPNYQPDHKDDPDCSCSEPSDDEANPMQNTAQNPHDKHKLHKHKHKKNDDDRHHHHLDRLHPCYNVKCPLNDILHMCQDPNMPCVCEDKRCALNEKEHECKDDQQTCTCTDQECPVNKAKKKERRRKAAQGVALTGVKAGFSVAISQVT